MSRLLPLSASEIVVQSPMISFMSEALRATTTELYENVGEDFRVSGSYNYDLGTH